MSSRSSSSAPLTCRLCGHEHQPVSLAPGERAHCVRCGTVLASRSRLGPDAAIAFTVTGLILALPALLLPFITASKLGRDRPGLLFTGVEGLWHHNMPLLAIWVCLCGTVVPLALFATLAGLLLPERLGQPLPSSRLLRSTAHALGHWAMPEVQVLAVLVALMKLGTLVNITIGAGFWCYAAMSCALLFAWHSFELSVLAPPSPEETAAVAAANAPAPAPAPA
ncbi:MAG TPA: paraquat-inducible protein A [Opitutus sp.]|nr:paraquat-inducible protein A [Opitutus sp.]